MGWTSETITNDRLQYNLTTGSRFLWMNSQNLSPEPQPPLTTIAGRYTLREVTQDDERFGKEVSRGRSCSLCVTCGDTGVGAVHFKISSISRHLPRLDIYLSTYVCRYAHIHSLQSQCDLETWYIDSFKDFALLIGLENRVLGPLLDA